MKNIKTNILIIAAIMILSGCRQEVELSNISGLSASPAQNGIYVSWTASSDANCYYIYRAAQNEASYSYWGVTDETGFTDITVFSGVRYSYRVYPARKTKKGYIRGDQYLSTQNVFLLAQPAISSVQTSETVCTIRWDAIQNASGYSVYRAEAGQTDYEYVGDAQLNYYIDTTYDGNKEYAYSIEANSLVDGITYRSVRSNAVQAYRAPAIASANREDFYTAVITWDSAVEGTEYSVYRALSQDGVYELLGNTHQTFFRDNTANQEAPEEALQVNETTEIVQTGVLEDSAEPVQADPTVEANVTVDVTMVPVNYYYKIQLRTESLGVLSYTNQSPGVLLDSAVKTSVLFVARYIDFVSTSTFPDVIANDEVYADEFEADLIDLIAQGYVTVTSKEVADYINNIAPLPEKAVMLTIDDARRGVYEYAYPLLEKYGMKAVLSVVGEYADNAQLTVDSARDYCNWDEIAQMANSGCFELASGSYYLDKTSDNSADGRDGVLQLAYETTAQYTKALGDDVLLINERLASITGQIPAVFAYPNAARDSISDAVLTGEFGYKLLFGDNDSRSTRMNYFIDNAPPYTQLLLLNRRDRLSGTALIEYIIAAQRFDAPSTSAG